MTKYVSNFQWHQQHRNSELFKEWISFFWGLSKWKLGRVQSEWIQKGFMETLLATQCSLHYKHQKIYFIGYIYSLFNQNLDIKSNISSKTEAIKQLHAVFLLTAEQGQWRHGVATL